MVGHKSITTIAPTNVLYHVPIVRVVDNNAIARHGAIRFRSEYHYALFEYWRSAKLMRCLKRAGVGYLGRVLDDGCGGGGMCVSLAEETNWVAGIDLHDRFEHAGMRLARELNVTNVVFAQANGSRLPFPDNAFDTVLSHAVIEHVADNGAYLREARRVMRPNGHMFLQTSPYLSLHGSHLPRLKVPIPLHLVFGRRTAFAVSRWLATHRPEWLDVPPDGSSFLTSRRGEVKEDDLLYRVTVRNLREAIIDAGFRMVSEDLYVSGLARRLFPPSVTAAVPRMPFARDILVTNMEYVLAA